MEQVQQASREPLVLLPGMMCDGRIFEPQVRTFSGSLPVMVLPLAGGSTVEEIAARMLPNLPPRFALAGLELGGTLALELIRRAPDRVTRICLMAATALADTPQQAADREPLIIAARTGRLQDALQATLPPNVLAPGLRRMQVLELYCRMGLELGPELYESQTRALQRRPDQQAVLRRVKVPALVLCGAHDPLAPVAKQEVLAALIPGARLEVIEDAGHMPVLEQPDAVNRALLSWLAERPEPAGSRLH